MDTSTIEFLANAAAIAGLGGSILLVVAKGLPIANGALDDLDKMLLKLTGPLRNVFNKDTALAKALKAKGVNPELADSAAELTADAIEFLLKAKVD